VLDNGGSLGVTAWLCRNCGNVVQQVFVLARGGKARFRSSRYIGFSSPA
jgi:hypothetical protein